jgi:hypothetical protein
MPHIQILAALLPSVTIYRVPKTPWAQGPIPVAFDTPL